MLLFQTEDVYQKVKLKFITAARNIRRGNNKLPTTIVQSFDRHETTIRKTVTVLNEILPISFS